MSSPSTESLDKDLNEIKIPVANDKPQTQNDNSVIGEVDRGVILGAIFKNLKPTLFATSKMRMLF